MRGTSNNLHESNLEYNNVALCYIPRARAIALSIDRLKALMYKSQGHVQGWMYINNALLNVFLYIYISLYKFFLCLSFHMFLSHASSKHGNRAAQPLLSPINSAPSSQR